MNREASSQRLTLAATLLAVVCLGLGAWLLFGPGDEPAAPAARGTVRLGIAREELAALAMIARDQGYYADEGLDVAVRDYASGKLALEAMLAGEVDLATVAEVPLVFAAFARDDFRILARIGTAANEPRIVARRSRGIERPEDLRGKRIATQQASAVHLFLHLFLVRHGLGDRDAVLSYRSPDSLVPALVDGEIDAFSMREPYVSQARAALGDDAVVFAEPGLYAKTMALAVAQGYAAGRGETLKKLLRAMLRAEDDVRADPARGSAPVAAWLGVEPAALAAAGSETELALALDQALLVGLEEVARWALETGLAEAPRVPDYRRFIAAEALAAVRPAAVSLIRREGP